MANKSDEIDKHSYPKRDFQIYTNGAFCEPLRFRHKDGEISWHWVVTEFNDESFRQGEIVFPKEWADTSEELLEFPEDDGE